jgi:hypothetical protein
MYAAARRFRTDPIYLRASAFICGSVLLSGCAGPTSKPYAAPATRPATEFHLTLNPPHAADPRDPQPPWEAVVHLRIYQISLARGSISLDTGFWKRVDETCLPPATMVLLNKNGIRCGTASRQDWDFFHDHLQAPSSAVKVTDLDGVQAHDVPLQLTRAVDSQTILYYDAADQLTGRPFENCVNQLELAFQPVPREPWAVRVVLCPAVRAREDRYSFTPLNQELRTTYTAVDRLYDLGLSVDVNDDSFLILAPNAAGATRSTSIGNRFFYQDGTAQLLEQVVVIVPSFLRGDGKPFTIDDTLVRGQ